MSPSVCLINFSFAGLKWNNHTIFYPKMKVDAIKSKSKYAVQIHIFEGILTVFKLLLDFLLVLYPVKTKKPPNKLT